MAGSATDKVTAAGTDTKESKQEAELEIDVNNQMNGQAKVDGEPGTEGKDSVSTKSVPVKTASKQIKKSKPKPGRKGGKKNNKGIDKETSEEPSFQTTSSKSSPAKSDTQMNISDQLTNLNTSVVNSPVKKGGQNNKKQRAAGKVVDKKPLTPNIERAVQQFNIIDGPGRKEHIDQIKQKILDTSETSDESVQREVNNAKKQVDDAE